MQSDFLKDVLVNLHKQFKKQDIMDLCGPAPSTLEGRATEIIMVEGASTSLDKIQSLYICNLNHIDSWHISLHHKDI